MRSDRGFIALYALLTLAFLTTIVVLSLAHENGLLEIYRRHGGTAKADRVAYSFLQDRLAEEHCRIPRLWLPAQEGVADCSGIKIKWSRRPFGRWRAGARVWPPELMEGWERLGASGKSLQVWHKWLEDRQAQRNPIWGIRGDLVTDPTYLRTIFLQTGLGFRWHNQADLWTTDEGGYLGRTPLLGMEPSVVVALTGVSLERIKGYDFYVRSGIQDVSIAQCYWHFEEWQALAPWVSLSPSDDEVWTFEVFLPELREPITTRWRSSVSDGLPGSPWFRVRPWHPEEP